jgi:hypothetical protein
MYSPSALTATCVVEPVPVFVKSILGAICATLPEAETP